MPIRECVMRVHEYGDSIRGYTEVAPLVRCKDCYWFDGVDTCARYDDDGGYLMFEVDPSDYCSFGIELKELEKVNSIQEDRKHVEMCLKLIDDAAARYKEADLNE